MAKKGTRKILPLGKKRSRFFWRAFWGEKGNFPFLTPFSAAAQVEVKCRLQRVDAANPERNCKKFLSNVAQFSLEMNHSLHNHGELPNNMVQTSSSLIFGVTGVRNCDVIKLHQTVCQKFTICAMWGNQNRHFLHFLFQQRIMQPLHGAVRLVGWEKEELRGRGGRWKSLAIYLYVGRVPQGEEYANDRKYDLWYSLLIIQTCQSGIVLV